MTEFEEITNGMSKFQLEREIEFQTTNNPKDTTLIDHLRCALEAIVTRDVKIIYAIKDLSEEIGIWQNNNFGDVSSTLNLLGIAEEVGELSHHHLKDIQGIRNNEDHRKGKIDSVGDILIFLINYCNKENINIGEALIDTWNEVSKRNWKANSINGVTKSSNDFPKVDNTIKRNTFNKGKISIEDVETYLKEVRGIKIGDKIIISPDIKLSFPIIYNTATLKSIVDTERVEILFVDGSTMTIDYTFIMKWTEK